MLRGFVADVRCALRSFAKSPGFFSIAVLTIALGIGATTAIFGVVHSVLFAPLGLAGEERLLRLRDFQVAPDGRRELTNTSGRSFDAIRDHNAAFDMVVAWKAENRTIPDWHGEGPERVSTVGVSSALSRTVGVKPVLGRDFSADEERAGAQARVVLISDSLWKRRFGGSASALGGRLILDRLPFTVVGVLGPGFHFPYEADVWTPERITATDEPAVFARMKPGVSLAGAQSDLDRIAALVQHQHPEVGRGFGMEGAPARESLIENEARVAVALMAVVGFFFLLVCADASNLLLARALSRRREAAIRAALGASRRHEIQRASAEALVLAVPAAALGILAGGWLQPLLAILIPDNLRKQLGVVSAGTDPLVVAFACGLAAVTVAVCAIVPVLRVSAASLERVLREAGRDLGGGRETNRLLAGLVVGELAFSLVLLSGAGLLAHHLDRLQNLDLGFTARGLFTFRVALPASRFSRAEDRATAVAEIVRAVSATPGVAGAGVTTVNPLAGGTWVTPLDVEGVAPAENGAALLGNYRLVDSGLFRTMGIPLLAGRDFDSRDGAAGAPVAIISGRLARHLSPLGSALGRRVRFGRTSSPTPWRTVVGVVGDVEDAGDTRFAWYLPYAQRAGGEEGEEIQLMVRARDSAAMGLVPAVRRAIASVDPELAAFGVSTMQAVRIEVLSRERFGAALAGVAAGLGLLIAAIGLAGLESYRVGQRRTEIAIRLALGARRSQVVAALLREGLRLVFFGLVLGTAGALVLDRLIRSAIPDIVAPGFALLAPLALVLAATALLCLAGPAVRATRMDPVKALR